jgi:hypothetical protein
MLQNLNFELRGQPLLLTLFAWGEGLKLRGPSILPQCYGVAHLLCGKVLGAGMNGVMKIMVLVVSVIL